MLKYIFIILFITNTTHISLATETDLQSLHLVMYMPSSCPVGPNPENVCVMFSNNTVGYIPKDKLPKNIEVGTFFRIDFSSITQLDCGIPGQITCLLKNVKSYIDCSLGMQPIYTTHCSGELSSQLTNNASQNVWILDLDNCILQDGLSDMLSPTALGTTIEQSIKDEKNKPAGVLFLTKRNQTTNKVLEKTHAEIKNLFPALYAFSISSDNVLSEATSNPAFTTLYTSSGSVIIMGDGTHTPCKGTTLLTLLQTATTELQERMRNLKFFCVDDQILNCTAYAKLSFQTIQFLPYLYVYPIENPQY